jgi:hypothetical protein
MPLAVNRAGLGLVAVDTYMPDSGTASSAYLAAPCKGWLRQIKLTLQGTVVGTADNTFSLAVIDRSSGGAVTNAITPATFTLIRSGVATDQTTWVQPTLNSAAGDVLVANLSGVGAHAYFVNEGDTITVTSDGAGSNTTPTMIEALIGQG